MFERPEDTLSTHPRRLDGRRSSVEDMQRISEWIAFDRVAESRAFDGGHWFGDGVLDVSSSRLTELALARLEPALASGRVKHLFACRNRLGPQAVRAVPRGPTLQSLWLGDNQIAAEGLLALADIAPNARALWLARAALDGRETPSVCEAIRRSTSLSALDLALSGLDADDSVSIVRAAHDRGLSLLSLDGNRLAARGAHALCELVRSWPALLVLRLNATDMGDDGVSALCGALEACPSLVGLGLSSNAVTDRGAESIAALVAAHPSLRAIELGFVHAERSGGAMPNALTGRGVRAILSAAAHSRALRSVDVRGASIATDDVDAIVRAVIDSRSIDAISSDALHQSAGGDALRAALAANANAARPREHALLRELFAPLRRWQSQFRQSVATGQLASRTSAAQPAPALAQTAIDEAKSTIERVRLRDLAGASLTEHERSLRAAVRSWGRPAERAIRPRPQRTKSEEEQAARARDRARLAATTLRQAREGADRAAVSLSDESARTLEHAQRCYACRQSFSTVDAHYDRLCPACARLHRDKRAQRADLRGCLAVVTGARVGIGFRATLSLLRNGCFVIATSRFVNDGWLRFAEQPDFDAWRARLELRPVDLRYTRDVERFADAIASEHGAVDVLLNNAAQTVARDASYYAAMRARDADAARALPAGIIASPSLTVADTMDAAIATHEIKPAPDDLRAHNSWRTEIDQVSTGELLSAHAVNVLAPYVLTARLRGALGEASARRGAAFVINVSAIEGQFAQRRKPSRHPHTNMAKAALNMLTLTIAEGFARENILVVSVDPGWVSAQNPFVQDAAMRATGFAPPLDEEDGAARVLDPVFRKKNGEPVEPGVLYKDFVVAPW